MEEVIQHTIGVIHRRSKRFRNTVIAVVSIPVVAGVWTLVVGSWKPLLGLLLLVPTCVLFLLLDVRAVQRWQRHVLALWQEGSLKLDIFAHGIRAIPKLPQHTVEGMLTTLPTQALDVATPQPSAATREALVATVEVISRYEMARQAWILGGVVVAVGSIMAAVVQMAWLPLAGLLVPALLPLVWHRYGAKGRRHLEVRLQQLSEEPDFEQALYHARTERLDATVLAKAREATPFWVVDGTVFLSL